MQCSESGALQCEGSSGSHVQQALQCQQRLHTDVHTDYQLHTAIYLSKPNMTLPNFQATPPQASVALGGAAPAPMPTHMYMMPGSLDPNLSYLYGAGLFRPDLYWKVRSSRVFFEQSVQLESIVSLDFLLNVLIQGLLYCIDSRLPVTNDESSSPCVTNIFPHCWGDAILTIREKYYLSALHILSPVIFLLDCPRTRRDCTSSGRASTYDLNWEAVPRTYETMMLILNYSSLQMIPWLQCLLIVTHSLTINHWQHSKRNT